MRKWTNDRQKRRKKGEGAAKERPANAPEPLQPKYFEAEIGEKPAEHVAEAVPAEPEHSSAGRASIEQPAVRRSRDESATDDTADFEPSEAEQTFSMGSPSVDASSFGSSVDTSSVGSSTVGSVAASGPSASGRPSSRRSSGRSRRSGRSRPAAQHAVPSSSTIESPLNQAEPPSTDGEKETQADFQLASRRLPELPLAEAVQNESGVRPARRRRKRGGRGGARPPLGGVAPGAPRGGATGRAPRELGASGASANFNAPLTPESASGDAIASPRSAGALAGAPRSSSAQRSAAPQRPAPAFPAQSPSAQSLPASSSDQSTAAVPLAPAGAIPAAPPRPSKGTVVLAIGLPGSGKSSWFKRHDIHPLSSDLLRELLFDDAMEQRFQDLIFSNLRSMLKARLIARRPLNYVDATNLTPHDRHSWIKLAKDYGYDVQGLFFDVPLEVCLERHARRGRAVPEDIMRKMAGKLKPPTFEEGFSKITVVRVKAKDAAAS
jgi:predicted kinase